MVSGLPEGLKDVAMLTRVVAGRAPRIRVLGGRGRGSLGGDAKPARGAEMRCARQSGAGEPGHGLDTWRGLSVRGLTVSAGCGYQPRR